MKQPTLSILTTCFNRVEFVAEAIESTLSQSFGDFEYIIVDDCSSDGSYEIILDYAKQDSRIRPFRNERNLGDYPNRNKAASYAAGKYIKYVDSDDILLEHAIDVMIRCMRKFPSAGIGLSAGHAQKGPAPQQLSPREAFLFHLQNNDLFCRSPGSVILLRDAFEKAGTFSGKAHVGDFECWIKMACMFDIILLPRDLIWCRQHPNQEQKYNSVEKKHEMINQAWRDTASRTDFPLTENEFKEFMFYRLSRRRYSKIKSNARSILRSRFLNPGWLKAQPINQQ